MATYHVWLCLIAFSQFNFMLAQSDTYIVHMDVSLMPKCFSGHHDWYHTILSSMPNDAQISSTSEAITTSKLHYVYSHAIHGFSARLSPLELKAIQDSPGFIYAIRDVQVTIDTSHSFEFLGLNDVSGAWPVSNYGDGIIIGVVDSGVWPESKSYRDHGMSKVPSRWKGQCETGTDFNSSMCNKKLIGARSFNKGLVGNDPSLNISMNSTRDTQGHGTHTSSIAAGNYVRGASYYGYANGTTRGMAPRAHLAIYKATWKEGTFTSDIIAAIDQAIADGVDVLSLSLSFDAFALYEDPIAIAAFAAMEKGIFVATSAGNRGSSYAVVDNGTPWVLTVGAATIDREFNGIATLGNGDSVTGLTLYAGKSSSTRIPLVSMGTCMNTTAIEKEQSKIVVCMDIDESLSEHVSNLRTAEVAGGIFITNITSLNSFLETSFPAIFLSLQEGLNLMDYINSSSSPRARLEFQKITSLGTKPAPSIAHYSSRGPSSVCPNVLKPDLVAPGSLILASWPQNVAVTNLGSRSLYSKFNVLSGTSMSCPHAAGLAALVKGAHPEWSPAAIKSAMMTTSDVLDNTQEPIKDIGNFYRTADPLAMGAGHVNPNKALEPGLIYDLNAADYVKLLCSMNYSMEQIQMFTRSSSYNCSNATLDINYPSFIAFFDTDNSSARIQEFRRTVTNVGDAMSTYTAEFTSMDGYNVTVVPDTLAFNEKNQKLSYTLTVESIGGAIEGGVFDSALSWVDVGRKHVVRSPLLVTTLGTEPTN